jgi:AAHS family 4-hydroxybenzoate transporter-like MFS transporter
MLFIIGGVVPLVAAALLIRALPESPRYLARHAARWPELVRLLRRMGHDQPGGTSFVDPTEQAATRTPMSALVTPALRGDTFALWGSFFFCLLAVYLGFSWLPSMLTGAGFSPAVASTGITAFNLGGVAGAIAGGLWILRVGSRLAMLTMAAGAIAGAVVLSTMTIAPSASLTSLLVMLTFTGGLINAVQTTMYALATNVYPSAVRATGVGTAVAVGRLGAILSGYAGAWALEYRGSVSYFMLIAAAMVMSFVALALIGRHVRAAGR